MGNLTLKDVGQVLADILGCYDVKTAYVFGSFARGDYTDSSDVDIRLECGPSMRYGILLEIQERLEAALDRKVDIVTCRPEHLRKRFRKHIELDEVMLYEAA